MTSEARVGWASPELATRVPSSAFGADVGGLVTSEFLLSLVWFALDFGMNIERNGRALKAVSEIIL